MCKFQANERHAFAREKARERGARPEDAARLFDSLHRAALSLDALATAPGMPPVAAQTLVATGAASAELFAAGRCFFIAQLRLAHGEPSMACAMLSAACERLKEAQEGSQGLEGSWADGGLQRQLLAQLSAAAAAFEVVANAEAAAAEEGQASAIAGGVANVNLDAAQAAHSKNDGTKYALQHLHDSESFATTGGKSRLFQLTSLLEQVPMRPVTLDTAQQFIEEPDVSHRCPAGAAGKEGGATMVQGLKSFFGFR